MGSRGVGENEQYVCTNWAEQQLEEYQAQFIGKSRNYISLIRIHSYFKASLLRTLTPGAFELPST